MRDTYTTANDKAGSDFVCYLSNNNTYILVTKAEQNSDKKSLK